MNLNEWLKSKPYWLKGGIIAILLFIFFEILLNASSQAKAFMGIPLAIAIIPYFLFDLLPNDLGYTIMDSNALHIIFSSLFYFIFGSFFGWIIGKINLSSSKLKKFYLPFFITFIHSVLVLSADTLFHPTDFATVILAPPLFLCYLGFPFIPLFLLTELFVFWLVFLIIQTVKKLRSN